MRDSLIPLLLSATALVAAAPASPWKQRSDSPEPRVWQVAAAIDGKIYLVTSGEDARPGCEVFEYNPAADTFRKKASCHVPREGLSAGVAGGKVYVWGGKVNGAFESTVEVYDPARDAWTVRAARMPDPAQYDFSATVAGKLYSIRPRALWEYDPAADRWRSRKAPALAQPAGRAAASGGKIYLAGGHKEAGRLVQQYDPASDTWTRRADIPTARADFTLIGFGGRVYAIGGANFSLKPPELVLQSVEVYDPAADGWTEAPALPKPHWEMVAAELNGRIYVFEGGWEPRCKAVYEFDPALQP